MDKKQHPKQVRIEPEMYEKAEKRAKQLGLTFSSYVRHLIAKDINGTSSI